MTTIVYRDGVIAADSRTTVHTEEGGSRFFRCEKLYPVSNGRGRITDILATAGESSSSLVFVDWYRNGAVTKDKPGELIEGDADFTVLVLRRSGLYEYDKWCRGEKILDRFYSIGSGSKAALGAMHAGANALTACRIACKVDPYSALPIVTMRLG